MVNAIDVTSDEVLVALARAGETPAFDLLVRRHQGRVHGVVRGFFRSEADIAECAQETWTSAWRRLDSFRGEASFLSWLLRIARNTCLMRLRTRRRHPEVSLEVHGDDAPYTRDLADIRPSSEDRLLLQELGRHIERATADLGASYLEVYQLADLQERSMKEIADQLGLSVPNVKTRLHRARARLRESLEPYLAGAV